MSMMNGSAARRLKPAGRPYVFAVNKKTGELYLEQEKPAFLKELPYVTVMAVTVLFAVCSCFSYLHLQTRLGMHVREISSLESQRYVLANQNELVEKELRQIDNLSYVYEVAVSELGMVPASAENVIVYDRTNSEFVYQTENIPVIGYRRK